MNQPLVSVVIVTKNEEKHIGNCLESVRRQTYPREKIETIVVDNPNSTDRTKEIARKYTDKVFNKGPERSAQRNFGMTEKSGGKYVMYLDADMILSSTVIEQAVSKLESGDLSALYLSEVILGNSFWSRVRRLERSFYDGTVIDCVRIVRKDVFVQVGGFDLSFTGQEDWDLDKKIRSVGPVAVLGRYDFEKISREVAGISYQAKDLAAVLSGLTQAPLLYHNEAEFSPLNYLSKKGYYLRTILAYIRKWGKDDVDIRRQTGLSYRLVGVFFENGKWKKLFRHPILAGGMYFLRFLVGCKFLLANIKS